MNNTPTKQKGNTKYKLRSRISKHLPGEIWEVRENERVFITSTKGATSEYVPSGNWQPYFLRDNAGNADYFEKVDNKIAKTDGGLFVIDPARTNVTTYIADILYQDGVALNEKVNELIDVINRLLEDSK